MSYHGFREYRRRKVRFWSARSFFHMGIVVAAPLSLLALAAKLAAKLRRF